MAELKASTDAGIRQLYSAPVQSNAEETLEHMMYTALSLEGASFLEAAQRLVMNILTDVQVECTKTLLMPLSVPNTQVCDVDFYRKRYLYHRVLHIICLHQCLHH